MARFEYEMDKAGVMEICKSPAMQAELVRLSYDIAAKANRRARADQKDVVLNGRHLRGGKFERDPYEAAVKVGRGTAFAAVNPTTEVATLYELETGTLDSFNH